MRYNAKRTNTMRYNAKMYLDLDLRERLLKHIFGYSQKVVYFENGNDQKIHIKVVIHESRTSLVTDIVSELKTFVKESNKKTGFNVDFEKDIVVDFYQIGNWNKKGKYEHGRLEYIK